MFRFANDQASWSYDDWQLLKASRTAFYSYQDLLAKSRWTLRTKRERMEINLHLSQDMTVVDLDI